MGIFRDSTFTDLELKFNRRSVSRELRIKYYEIIAVTNTVTNFLRLATATSYAADHAYS